MRIATIDIGTNTVLMLIADASGGEIHAVEEHATITRLGYGVDRAGALAPEAIARTVECLERYAAVVERLGVTRVACVGTSAMRDAGGGETVRARVRELFGVEARVVSGDEEARLTFIGALAGLDVGGEREVTVFDVGGGSTEIVRGKLGPGGLADVELAYARSFDVGSVRMTERHVASDPPTRAELAALDAALGDVFDGVTALPASTVPVGIAGTMTALVAIALAMEPYDVARVRGYVMSIDELRSIVGRMETMTVEERRRLPGMEEKRADVIVAGGHIAIAVLARLGATAVRISDRGVRWGVAVALAASDATV